MNNEINKLKCEQILSLVSPIPPSVNHYLGWRAIMKGKRPVVVSYETSEAKKYKKEFIKYIKDEVLKQEWIIDNNGNHHIYMDCVFYFDRKDKDANNYFKCLADAITESNVVWKDDNILCERVNGIFYDSANPRIELIIHYTDYVGIFLNKNKLDEFEDVCKSCKRYKNNCSILNKAKEGRIIDDISYDMGQYTCSKYKGV